MSTFRMAVPGLVALVLYVFPALVWSDETAPPPSKTYEATWESLKTIPVPNWFEDAKFGIFIHWGPYSVIGHRRGGRGYAEHVPKLMYAERRYYYPCLEERFGACPPEFGYKDVVRRFKAENWDPEAWAELFEKAGARYVVLTAEHHDGYALWDSDLTEWCATKVGPKRDLVADLAEAVRRRGMKFAPSYHRERHPGFFAKQNYAVESTPRGDVAEEIRREPAAAELYGPFSYTDEFIEDYVARWKELQTKYRPDFMWIDDIPIFYLGKGPQVDKFRAACRQMIADYMNAAAAWPKEVYLNNKGRREPNWPEGVGCRECDHMNVRVLGPKWQKPTTMGTSFGYMAAEEEADRYKSATHLIHMLCDVVSKNGNLLLNIGPRPDGTIPEGMRQRLLAIGKWLGTNGEAIYGTTCWKVYGEGKIRYTRKADVLYAILPSKPDGRLLLESLAGVKADRIKAVSFLGTDRRPYWHITDDGLTIEPSGEVSGEHAFIVKIEGAGEGGF